MIYVSNILINYIFQRSVFLPAKMEVNVFHQTHVIAQSRTLVLTVSTSENAALDSLPPLTMLVKSATLSEYTLETPNKAFIIKPNQTKND